MFIRTSAYSWPSNHAEVVGMAMAWTSRVRRSRTKRTNLSENANDKIWPYYIISYLCIKKKEALKSRSTVLSTPGITWLGSKNYGFKDDFILVQFMKTQEISSVFILSIAHIVAYGCKKVPCFTQIPTKNTHFHPLVISPRTSSAPKYSRSLSDQCPPAVMAGKRIRCGVVIPCMSLV